MFVTCTLCGLSSPKALLGLAGHVREAGPLPALPQPPVRSVALFRRPNRPIHLFSLLDGPGCFSAPATVKHSFNILSNQKKKKKRQKKRVDLPTLKALCIHCGRKSPLFFFFPLLLRFSQFPKPGHLVYPLHLCLCLVPFA